jgi:large subunit ribosomal protein L23
MALFGGKKKNEGKAKDAQAIALSSSTPVVVKRGVNATLHPGSLILRPRITEKATMHSADSVYTFDIAENATKRDVMQAVQALYKVAPRMVRVVTIPTKMKRNARTGKRGMTRGGKKAYVYLKKGETITIM